MFPFIDGILFRKAFSFLFCPFAFFLGQIFFFSILGYKIRNFKEHRRQYRAILKKVQGKPLLICMNHITRIDSLILLKALIAPWKCLFHFPSLPWHVYEKRMVPAASIRFIMSLGKAIPIWSLGPRDQLAKKLNLLCSLLKRGEKVLIFPEGRRTMTGRIEKEEVHYGSGQLLQKVSDCAVLCVYLRADEQKQRSEIPKCKSIFTLSFELIEPKTNLSGLRGARDLSHQIIAQLDLMEQQYFANRE